jgi:hypothetical protein
MQHSRTVLRRLVSPRVWVLTAVVFALGASTSAFAAGKWAVVNSAGTLIRGNGATSSTLLSTGTYQVAFSSNQTNCAYISTPGDTGAGAVSGPIINTVASRAGNPNALFIQAFDQSTGTVSSQPLHVATYCGTKKLYAVVDATGNLARGPRVVSSARLSAGNYEVIFNRKIKNCAFTATLGTTGTGSIPAPGLITVAGRAGNFSGVFVRIVDRTGTSLDSSFHLAVTCSGLFAVVESNGTLARGGHVTSLAKLSGANGGTYEVIFDRTVSGCAYTATIGTTTFGGSIGPPPVTITTATRAGNPNGVFIFEHQASGATIDEPFHLVVSC